jgi:hypothetical protein
MSRYPTWVGAKAHADNSTRIIKRDADNPNTPSTLVKRIPGGLRETEGRKRKAKTTTISLKVLVELGYLDAADGTIPPSTNTRSVLDKKQVSWREVSSTRVDVSAWEARVDRARARYAANEGRKIIADPAVLEAHKEETRLAYKPADPQRNNGRNGRK